MTTTRLIWKLRKFAIRWTWQTKCVGGGALNFKTWASCRSPIRWVGCFLFFCKMLMNWWNLTFNISWIDLKQWMFNKWQLRHIVSVNWAIVWFRQGCTKPLPVPRPIYCQLDFQGNSNLNKNKTKFRPRKWLWNYLLQDGGPNLSRS